MGRHELEYPKDATNLVKRHGERGRYELETIHSIINTCPLLHVSFNPPNSEFPVTLPMIGQMGAFDRPSASLGDPMDLYLHGYTTARMFNVSRAATTTTNTNTTNNNNNNNTSTPIKADDNNNASETKEKGMPVCIAASHIDGIILALSPFNHSYNYRSAILFGHATPVESNAEKLYAMELITDGVVPGRWAATRQPPTAAEMQSTSILRVRITSGSAKIREGGVADDGRDLEDEGTVGAVWSGLVPVWMVAGEPVPSEYCRVPVPEHVAEFVGGAWGGGS